MAQIRFNINGKSYTWKSLNRLSKAHLLAEAQQMGSSVDSLTTWTKASLADYLIDLADRKASAPADEAMPEDATPIWGEELTAEERDLVDEYMDTSKADYLSVREAGAGTWEIEEDGEVLCFDTAKDLMEHITSALREIYEEYAMGYESVPTCFYEYFPDECGEHALVAVRYTPAFEQADVSGAYEIDGKWFYFTFTDKADYFTISDRERFLDYFNGDTEGYSEGTYDSFGEVLDNCANGDALLRELGKYCGGYATVEHKKSVVLFQLINVVDGVRKAVTSPCPYAWIAKGWHEFGYSMDGVELIARPKTIRTHGFCPTYTKCRIRGC